MGVRRERRSHRGSRNPGSRIFGKVCGAIICITYTVIVVVVVLIVVGVILIVVVVICD